MKNQARLKCLNLRQCPTCKSILGEPAPGINRWPTDSTYQYLGEEHTCHCKWQDTLRRHYLLAHIPKGYWTYGKQEYYGDPEAWKMAEQYLNSWDNFKDLGIGIEFHSATQGTGKTFLVSWIARQLIQRQESVYYIRFREIMGLFHKPYEIRQEEEDRLRYSPVLVLDEVGTAISGEQGVYFAVEFENLIRARVDDNRVTLMTTNLTPEEIDDHYPRTYSLLSAKQQRYAIKAEDARRAGHVYDIDLELAAAHEARPLC